MFVYLTGEAVALEVGVLLQPILRLDDFVRISCGCQDLRDQRVRVQSDRGNELLQLFRTLLRSLGRLCQPFHNTRK